MRQRSTVPLLAVILAAVHSRGKSFSQSLASHTICLPDAGIKVLLHFLLPPLPCIISLYHHTFPLYISSSIYFTVITPPPASFSSIYPLSHHLLSIFNILTWICLHCCFHFFLISSHSTAPFSTLLSPKRHGGNAPPPTVLPIQQEDL